MTRYSFDKDIDEKAEKGGFVLVPPGKYPMRLKDCKLESVTNKQGETHEVWKARMVIEEGQWTGEEVKDTLFFTPKTQVRVYKFFKAFGSFLTADSLAHRLANLDTNGSQDVLVGRTAMVEVEHRTGTIKDKKTGMDKQATFANPTFAGYEPLEPGAKSQPAAAGAGPAPAAGGRAIPPDEELPF